MTDSDEVKLLPCPFCNMAVSQTKFGFVEHPINDDCPLSGSIHRADQWNTRPPVVTDEVVERVAEVETGLRVAMVASCNCEHEANISPKPEAHDLTCRYRVLYVAADLLADIRLASMPAVVSGGQGKCEFLLLASYCGNDNPACTEARPCADCLSMCNVFDARNTYLRQLGLPAQPEIGE